VELVDTKRAAEILGVSRRTLEGWRTSGRISVPFRKIGSRVLYDVERDLIPFVEAQRRVSTSDLGGEAA
jgi:predicted site-specific integrase-resolvase